MEKKEKNKRHAASKCSQIVDLNNDIGNSTAPDVVIAAAKSIALDFERYWYTHTATPFH